MKRSFTVMKMVDSGYTNRNQSQTRKKQPLNFYISYSKLVVFQEYYYRNTRVVKYSF